MANINEPTSMKDIKSDTKAKKTERSMRQAENSIPGLMRLLKNKIKYPRSICTEAPVNHGAQNLEETLANTAEKKLSHNGVISAC